MNAIIDKVVILICTTMILIFSYPEIGFFCIMAFLTAIAYTCLAGFLHPDLEQVSHLKENPIYIGLLISYLGISLIHPAFCLYLPLLFYDLLNTRFYYLYALSLPLIFVQITLEMPLQLLLIFMLFVLTYLLHKHSSEVYLLNKQLKIVRDDSQEFNLMLSQKNKDLLEKQDYEIYLATLKERNRIAREIHDNVGHMLSRSLLQVGALIAINKNDILASPLHDLKDTLSGAMDNIRSSVHDLHDNSIDLKATITSILDEYGQYQIAFEYDMERVIPRNVKYAFIAIIKEALSNIVKHSNASEIHIVIREHPSIYQLIVDDNGANIGSIDKKHSGIGLENMQERIHALHGSFSYQTEHGFRIFISVPKGEITED